MKKVSYLIYAAICYLIFFVTFLYLVGFISNLFVPKTLDAPGDAAGFPWYTRMLIDLGLMSIFAIQHSVMARRGFKRKWTQIIPEPIERSTYVLFASATLILLLVFWQPLPAVIWNVSSKAGQYGVMALSFFGWGIVLISTFLINHFHLFGLHQVYHYNTREAQNPLQFKTPFLYKMVRHPLYLGFLIAFWAAPLMTAGHLLFSLVMTLYIFIGIYHEEKDLGELYGPMYERYRKKTPKIFPYTR